MYSSTAEVKSKHFPSRATGVMSQASSSTKAPVPGRKRLWDEEDIQPQDESLKRSAKPQILEEKGHLTLHKRQTLSPRKLTALANLFGDKFYGTDLPRIMRKREAEIDSHESSALGRMLDNYIGIRAGTCPQKQSPTDPQESSSLRPSFHPEPSSLAPKPITTAAPTPQLPLEEARQIIFSVDTLHNAELLNHITQLYPQIDIIERDFSSTCEADVITSPSTGIICTTLQKLSQRPLPGIHLPQSPAHQQPQQLTTKEHISRVSLRYERLIILVTDAPIPLCASDAELYADFVALATRLGTEINLIPGDPAIIGQWINFYIAHSSFPPADSFPPAQLSLIPTPWEIFLCAAGFNAFAAQIVLQRAPPAAPRPAKGRTMSAQMTPASPSPSRLLNFVRMSREEKVDRFWGVCGGTRVLERVHGNLTLRWKE